MSKTYSHLSMHERTLMQVWLEHYLNLRAIARKLGRSPSTITREFSRNEGRTTAPSAAAAQGRPPIAGGYRCARAHHRAQRLACKPRVARKMVNRNVLRVRVLESLRGGFSPEQASGILARMPDPVRISHETIYTALYATTVGELASTIHGFAASRQTLLTDRVGTGLVRALYSTYVSYLPVEAFAYSVPQHGDPRGVFVEMLKTPDCGQFSYFTAHPGVTRGGHYHHSKTEKFLVIKGEARFKFRHMHTGETFELRTSGEKAEVVETVPGWTHDITNMGQDEMVVMLWANEVFDRARPDTFACAL